VAAGSPVNGPAVPGTNDPLPSSVAPAEDSSAARASSSARAPGGRNDSQTFPSALVING
jgi:hypothetical protein